MSTYTTTAANLYPAVQMAAESVKGACGIAPETKPVNLSALASVTGKSRSHAVMAKVALLWESGSTISYSFFGGTPNQQKAVTTVAEEWTYYANLTLQLQDFKDPAAMIRITFDANGGSWSSVGRGALQIKNGKPTMNLGWIEDSEIISQTDRGTILHEWGHALGLMHEHQSPARGGAITLKPDEVYQYYRSTQGWDNALIKSQILDVYNVDNISNYSKLDTKSIMMYFMPGRLNVEGITVNVNNSLTDMDKAYMVINYTRNVPHPRAKAWTLEKALKVAGFPLHEQGDILTNGDSNSRRAYFASWNKEVRAKELETVAPVTAPSVTPLVGTDEVSRLLAQLLGTQYGANPNIHYGINPGVPAMPPVGIEHGIWSGIVGVLKHPVFQEVVSGVIDNVLTQRGLASPYAPQRGLYNQFGYAPNPIYPSSGQSFSTEIQQGVWANALNNPIFKQIVSAAVNTAFTQHGIQPNATIDVQQGLFSDIGSILNHPVIRNALGGIVDIALRQRGLSPATTAEYPGVQQGVWSGLVGVLKDPTFQKAISTVVDAAFTQRGINPISPQAPSPVQYGLFSDIGSFLSHPAVREAIGGVVNIALQQRGLDPSATAVQYPDVQQGIISGIGSILTSPILREVVGTVVDAALKQRGLNSQTANVHSSVQSPDVQQGIFSGITSILAHPVFQQVVGTVIDAALSQRGIKSSFINHPPIRDTLTTVVNTALAQHGLIPHAATLSPDVPYVQQGLFSDIGNLLAHPLVRQTLTNVISTSLQQRGLNPGTTTTTQHPEIQQGLLSGIVGVLTSPAFQQVVGSVVNTALGQHALQPISPIVTPTPNVQQGLFSSIGSFVNNPLVHTALSTAIDAALGQRGLNPQVTATYYPDVQQGIWSGIVGVLKNSTFQKVVGTVVDAALTQRGIRPAVVTNVQHGLSSQPSALRSLSTDIDFALAQRGLNSQTTATLYSDVQQGIWSGIVNVIKDPAFQSVVGTVVDFALAANPVLATGLAPTGSQQGLHVDSSSQLPIQQALSNLAQSPVNEYLTGSPESLPRDAPTTLELQKMIEKYAAIAIEEALAQHDIQAVMPRSREDAQASAAAPVTPPRSDPQLNAEA